MSRNEMLKVISRLQKQTEIIDFKMPIKQTGDIKKYLKFYGLPSEEKKYHFGNVYVDSYLIKVQMFEPQNSREENVVLLLHGYLDHVGILSDTIHFLTKAGYKVVTFDWPGHGLSSGETAEINDFGEYERVYELVVNEISKQLNTIPNIVAHSTGAAVVISDLLKSTQTEYKSIILIAPLIRSNLWTITKVGYYFMKPLVKRVKRVVRQSSADQHFIDFLKKDPFQPSLVPLKWLKALIDWNDQVHSLNEKGQRVLVLQGVEDGTVDWRYNCQFIARLFYNSQIILYDEGKHHLLNEIDGIRLNVYEKIVRELNKQLYENYKINNE
ncbi:alpha/beta hydrolase [Alkalihalobacterium elongatum]|uniref:alpha/beta hydrolase n=1 Tax=Alkalihalobacterium elongatum TaxID=2675466 RepID=UPI001C1FED9F|nr:alpha/beta hydrolase [Alkalihalobacterium elongatum]